MIQPSTWTSLVSVMTRRNAEEEDGGGMNGRDSPAREGHFVHGDVILFLFKE